MSTPIDYEDLETACAYLSATARHNEQATIYVAAALRAVEAGRKGEAKAYLELAISELERTGKELDGGWAYYRRENLRRLLRRAK